MFNFDYLDYYTGTEQYYKAPLIWFNYTDGVKYISDNGGHWLIQDIALFTMKHREDDFICVECKFKNKKADIYFSDGNENVWQKYHVAHTPDFDNGEIKFYIYNDVCLLASEY